MNLPSRKREDAKQKTIDQSVGSALASVSFARSLRAMARSGRQNGQAEAISATLAQTAVLVAMWLAHFFLFRNTSLLAWIGTLVVVENVISSLSSSHLFDFVHGWLYVLGAGILGGVMNRDRVLANESSRRAEANSI